MVGNGVSKGFLTERADMKGMMDNMGMAGEEPMQQGVGEEAGRGGYTICVNCYADGKHDVYSKPLEPASESEYPDGIFGLESTEEALKAVISLKRQGSDYQSAEEEEMMRVYGGKGENDEGEAS